MIPHVQTSMEVRQSKRDTVQDLLVEIDRLRRKVSRLQSFGVLPEEYAVRLGSRVLEMREVCEEWLNRNETANKTSKTGSFTR